MKDIKMLSRIKSLFSHSINDSLRTNVKKGIVWTLGISFWTRLIGILSSIIVTRILLPHEFGLMAIVTSVIAIVTGLSVTGFESAIIQKQENADKLFNSAWTMEVTKGLFLFFLIFFTAPLIANYYGNSNLILMFRVLGITFLFKGFENVGVVLFRKNLDIRKEFVLYAIPDLIYFITVIILVFSLRNIWALILATAAASFTRTAVSYVIHPYRPRIEINMDKYRELFAFGKWVYGSSIVVMTRNQGVSLFVGKYFGMGILGYYNRGDVFSQKIFNEVIRTLWKVGFPAFSKLSTDKKQFKKYFLLTLKVITLIGFPMVIGFIVLSTETVNLILTERWTQIVPIIQLFAIAAIPSIIQTPFGISFISMGKPDINTKLALVNLLIFILLIYPVASNYGVKGIIILSALINLLILPIGWTIMCRMLGVTFIEFLSSTFPQMIISLIMGYAILLVKTNVLTINSLTALLLCIIWGIVVYYFLVYVSDKLFKTDLKSTWSIFIR